MNYETAVHEAGHAVAAQSVGLAWTLRATPTEDYEARIETSGWPGFEQHILTQLCGPYAQAALTGEPLNEDYHWKMIEGLSDDMKAGFEVKAEEFVYANWSEIVELADRWTA